MSAFDVFVASLRVASAVIVKLLWLLGVAWRKSLSPKQQHSPQQQH
jgi:hypothetical protein